MVPTPTTRSLNYLEALNDAPTGEIGNLWFGVDNIRTHFRNNIVELTTTIVEIERVKLGAVQVYAKNNAAIFHRKVQARIRIRTLRERSITTALWPQPGLSMTCQTKRVRARG